MSTRSNNPKTARRSPMTVRAAQAPTPRQRPGAALPHWPVFRCPRLAGLGCPPRAFALHEADAFVKKLADQSYADALRSMTDYVADNLNSEHVVSRLTTELVQ